MFLTYTRAMPNFFSSRIVVDAGCGNGRYINILNQIAVPPPKLVVGIDLSESIFVAAKNCAKFDNVIFIKMNLNLIDKILREPVDYVYSIGVLHHTPDAKGLSIIWRNASSQADSCRSTYTARETPCFIGSIRICAIGFFKIGRTSLFTI